MSEACDSVGLLSVIVKQMQGGTREVPTTVVVVFGQISQCLTAITKYDTGQHFRKRSEKS
jgi:hypothetical protein